MDLLELVERPTLFSCRYKIKHQDGMNLAAVFGHFEAAKAKVLHHRTSHVIDGFAGPNLVCGIEQLARCRALVSCIYRVSLSSLASFWFPAVLAEHVFFGCIQSFGDSSSALWLSVPCSSGLRLTPSDRQPSSRFSTDSPPPRTTRRSD